MIRTENTGWELYVYFNEVLIYKRWLKNGQAHGMMFHGSEAIKEMKNEMCRKSKSTSVPR